MRYRTTITLDYETYQLLKKYGHKWYSRVSMGEIIRRMIDDIRYGRRRPK